MIIVIEGIDGSGKSTLCKYLTPKLSESLNSIIEVVHWYSFVEYPSEIESLAFSGAKKLKAAHLLEPLANSLWHCADFAYRWQAQVIPALKERKTVLFDRSMYSALVRDCERGVDEDYVKKLYSYVAKPDLVVYLDVPAKIAADRKGNNIAFYEAGLDLKENENKSIINSFIEFQERCRIRYKKILPKDALIIDATLPQGIIANMVVEAASRLYQSNIVCGNNNSHPKPLYRMEAV
jgi:dTMP kinase